MVRSQDTRSTIATRELWHCLLSECAAVDDKAKNGISGLIFVCLYDCNIWLLFSFIVARKKTSWQQEFSIFNCIQKRFETQCPTNFETHVGQNKGSYLEPCLVLAMFLVTKKLFCNSTSIDHYQLPLFSFITTTNGLICLLPANRRGQVNWSGLWQNARAAHCCSEQKYVRAKPCFI